MFTYNSTGTLAQTNFGNGGIVANEYDDWNRLTGVKYEGDLAPRYTYAYNANGQVAHVTDAALNRVTQTEYDLANRPCRKKTHENGVHAYTGEVAYDPMTGNLSKFTERVGAGHVPYHTAFGYDEENRPVHLQYSNGAQVTYTYDKLGRVTHRTVNLNGTPLTTAYTYAAGRPGENSTSPLVESISQLDKTTVYGYDDCGNIRYESTAGVAVAYAYDPLGQLIRVNDPYDGTAGNGTTWEYEYDQGGNITAKKAYAYTDGLVSTPVQTVPYTYGDSNWKDKLTAYNNSFIAYDAIGNPLGDGTWTYTWAKGRQLQSMSKAGETVSFSYNSDGLRVRKVATSTGVTDYTLHGKNLVHLTNGTNSLHFYYDAQNRPAVVEFNWAPYAYVHNLQGDIIAIVDGNGNKVVEYKYDAWGRPLSKTGSMANTLGTLNPFRYRGYVYDEETDLYYLRSRFYSPDIDRFLNVDKLVSTDNSILNHNTFAYCSNNPVAFSDQDGTYKTVKLWGNWVYILDREVTSTMVKKHIVVTNGKKYYSQNIDGSPHDRHKNSPGDPPNSIKKHLKENDIWDWDGNKENYTNSIKKASKEAIKIEPCFAVDDYGSFQAVILTSSDGSEMLVDCASYADAGGNLPLRYLMFVPVLSPVSIPFPVFCSPFVPALIF